MRRFSVGAVFAFMAQMLAEGESCSFARRDDAGPAGAAMRLVTLVKRESVSRLPPLLQATSYNNVPPVGSGQLAPVPARPQ